VKHGLRAGEEGVFPSVTVGRGGGGGFREEDRKRESKQEAEDGIGDGKSLSVARRKFSETVPKPPITIRLCEDEGEELSARVVFDETFWMARDGDERTKREG